MSTASLSSSDPKSSTSSSSSLASPAAAPPGEKPPPSDSPSSSSSSSSSAAVAPAASPLQLLSLPPHSLVLAKSSSSSLSSKSNATSHSPPTHPKPSAPATPSSSSSSSSSSNALSPPSTSSNGSGINTPLVVGVAAGVGAFFVLLILACICSSRRKKRRKGHNPMQYYEESSNYKVSDSGDFYGGAPSTNWHQGTDHPAKPNAQPGGGGGSGWHPQPPLKNATEVNSGPLGPVMPPPSPALALGLNTSTFTYEELAAATNGFSQANLLGQGGFGYVHKGVLPNGKEVAVKQLKSGSGQGEREFHAEVDIISRVHHRHLVSLVGYCIAGSQRMLVYEFVPNKTLEYHLHAKGLPAMCWATRLRIALGSARGLAYLHEDCHPRIIHRDIKSANILLDFKFEAMVADFGLAKLTNDNHTHVSTRVMGTFGYLAPEYASSGKLTEKSDVFSYGVMLLELITGKRPVDSSHTFMEDSLVEWARPVLSRALADGNYDEIADTRLNGNYDPVEMARMLACAAAAVRHSARRRPKMSQIVRALEGEVSLEDLNEGMRPGQSMLFGSGSDYDASPYGSGKNRMRKFAVPSPEYGDEFSGPLDAY